MDNTKGQNQRNESLEFSGDEISLKPLILTLWGYRRIVAASVSIILILFVIGALYKYLSQPIERQVSIEFQLLFEGADKDRYPNGLLFSRADILSTPVLTAVYDANDLKRYCSYDDFKNQLFILETSQEQELLQLEYNAKLSDTRLSAVDRSRLEEEFRQKQQALRVAHYVMEFSITNSRVPIPESLMSKVLNDILATWAEQAANQKGVLTYQTRVYTGNVLLKDTLAADDYIVRLDVMRYKINDILGDVDDLLKLPGASVIRIGQNRISLPEVRANLQDVRQFRIEPLMGILSTSGIARDTNELLRYVEGRLSQSKLDHQEALGRVRTLQDALNAYMREHSGATSGGRESNSQGLGAQGTTMIPQLSESFLDRLITMSNQNGDVQYRQRLTDQIIAAGQAAVSLEKETAYYDELAASLRRNRSNVLSREAGASIDKQFDGIYAAVERSLDQIGQIYKELSRQNLNPRTTLYTITGPFAVITQRALTLRTLTLYAALILMVSLLLVPLACIVHHYFIREILPSGLIPRPAINAKDPSIEAKARHVGLSE